MSANPSEAPEAAWRKMWSLKLQQKSQVLEITADMIPRDSRYVAIRVIRAEPAPEIVVHMTTRTRSKSIVSASYPDRRGRYQPNIPQWRIPSTFYVDRWLAYSMAYGPNAQFIQQSDDKDSRAASQSWSSSRLDRFSYRPSPYSPGSRNFFTEKFVSLSNEQLAKLFVKQNGFSRAVIVNHGYVGDSIPPIFNTTNNRWPKSTQIVNVLEDWGENSPYHQTDIYASSAFDQSALQASDFPLSLSLSSPSPQGQGGAVLVSFVCMESSTHITLSFTLTAMIVFLLLAVAIACVVFHRKRCRRRGPNDTCCAACVRTFFPCCRGNAAVRATHTHQNNAHIQHGDVAVVRAISMTEQEFTDAAATPVVLELASEADTGEGSHGPLIPTVLSYLLPLTH